MPEFVKCYWIPDNFQGQVLALGPSPRPALHHDGGAVINLPTDVQAISATAVFKPYGDGSPPPPPFTTEISCEHAQKYMLGILQWLVLPDVEAITLHRELGDYVYRFIREESDEQLPTDQRVLEEPPDDG